MKTASQYAILIAALCLFLPSCARSPHSQEGSEGSDFDRYAGRYTNGPLSLFTVEAVGDYLAIVPPFWTSKPYLRADRPNEFSMRIPHIDRDRRIQFLKDERGRVVALEAFDWNEEIARFERVDDDTTLPVELLFAGQIEAALEQTDSDPSVDEETWTAAARSLLIGYPARRHAVRSLLDHLTERYPESAPLHALHGYSLLAVGERDEAARVFERAVGLDPESTLASDALRRLRIPEPGPGEGYRKLFPYNLAALFAAPDAQEIERVRSDWARRDLSPNGVATVATETLELEHATYDVRVVKHLVHGDEHYGAILTPKGATAGSLPIIIESRGVNARYTPLDISEGTQLMRALGELQDRFLLVIPAFRGETLVLGDRSYVSGGDRADSWDGATDDTIALLNVALEVEPAADPERIAAYGKSRGGSVALLTGIRDDRIDLVLNLAGPTDWFQAMESRFWSTEEILRDVLRDAEELVPTQQGGQFYERFIAPVARGDWTLADARHSMIAGSPLYFLETLPKSHSFYGAQDRSVPILNAELLAARIDELGRAGNGFELTVYPERGHDTEPFLAFREMVEELEELLRS